LGKFTSPLPNDIVPLDLATRLRSDPHSINMASNDYGNLVHESPSAVLYPSSIDDIVNLIKFSNNCSTPFGISARGRGHSVRGQAMARGGCRGRHAFPEPKWDWNKGFLGPFIRVLCRCWWRTDVDRRPSGRA
ncbi:UNVERIFIED_CONTAM: Cytokinin dehydrogenase 3, partial [Sesamum radiatum]